MKYNCGALYVTDTSLIGAKILNTLPNLVKSYAPKEENGVIDGMIVHLDEVNIECNFMSGDELAVHLQGLKNFVSTYLKQDVDINYVNARIDNVRLVIGCIAHHAENVSKPQVFDFMIKYNCELRSMAFCGDALLDYDWQCLAELPLENGQENS